MSSIDTSLAANYSLPLQPGIEKVLVEQARNGQQAAFAQLVEAHSEKVMQLAWRLVGNRAEAEVVEQGLSAEDQVILKLLELLELLELLDNMDDVAVLEDDQ